RDVSSTPLFHLRHRFPREIHRSKVRHLAATGSPLVATQDIERQASEQADRLYADELMRLRLLLEASSTLLGSLSVEAMLPEILALSRRTLAADGYAVWQYDGPRDSWSIAAHSGLSDRFVASAGRAVQGRATTVSLNEP